MEEHGSAIAFEQHHRVVDQAGQDPVEVEPTADVAGDPAKGLSPMEQMRHLPGALGAADDGADPVRGHPRDVEIPEIGDELAAARALEDLAGKLRAVAADDIAAVTSEASHGW